MRQHILECRRPASGLLALSKMEERTKLESASLATLIGAVFVA